MFPHERSLVQDMQGRPFVLLGVNNDEKVSRVQQSVKKNKINWRSFIDGGSGPIVRMFGIRGFPTIMLIDHHGVIVHANIRGKKLDEEIQRLVDEAEGDGFSGDKVEPEFRTFRDKTGKHRIVAKAESWDGDDIVLRKKDGEKVTMAVSSLSRTDQAYLKTVDLEPSETEDAASEDDAADSEADDGAGDDYRVFVDASGKHEIDARFVKLEDDNVILRKRDGSTVELPLDRLSEKDQQFVRDQK